MAERASSSTALVPLVAAANDAAAPESAVRQSAVRQSRANADFVAHLIATKGQLPQTRARRRAEPETAIAAYAALGHWPTRCGRALSRSL
jgi:hypothetical protein